MGVSPNFENCLPQTVIVSIYPANLMSICPRFWGYSPSKFGRKTKVKAVVGIFQNYGRGKLRRRLPSTTCITLGLLCRYMIPSRAARVIFENSKIYSIFGAAPLFPYGSQLTLHPDLHHLPVSYQGTKWKQTTGSPISAAM